MAKINFSANINSEARNLHVQTNTLESEEKIVLTLFDGGRVLFKEEKKYSPELKEEELKEIIKELHCNAVDEINFIYLISARVKAIKHPQSCYKLGLQFLKWNLLDEAISLFILAIQYDPDLGDVYLNLGEAYHRNDNHDEEIKILKKGLEEHPVYADLWNSLGRAYIYSSIYDEAIAAFKESLKINSSFNKPNFLISVCYMMILKDEPEQNDLSNYDSIKESVVSYLKKAAASGENRNEKIEGMLNEFEQGKVDDPLKFLKIYEEQFQQTAVLEFDDKFYLNYLYGDNGRDINAVENYIEKIEKMADEFPAYPDICNKLGIAYMMQSINFYNRSLSQFNKACELKPNYKKAQTNFKLANNKGKGLLILLRAMLK